VKPTYIKFSSRFNSPKLSPNKDVTVAKFGVLTVALLIIQVSWGTLHRVDWYRVANVSDNHVPVLVTSWSCSPVKSYDKGTKNRRKVTHYLLIDTA
jgi:hypothetical protein